MKRGILVFLVFLTLLGIVLAQQNEISVTFYSFGKNATINLKNYFGEGHSYLVSETQNVIVTIDQETGIARIVAKPGWEGSEVIRFRTNESVKVEETEEVTNLSTSEIFYPPETNDEYFQSVEYEKMTDLFQGTIDPSMLEFVRLIEREEITSILKEIKGKTITIKVNDEVDLNLEQNYTSTVSMNFSFDMNKKDGEAQPKETGIDSIISNITVITILLIIALLGIYFYSKEYVLRKKVKRKKPTLDEDIKHLSLNKLKKIQNELHKKESFQDFMNVLREFFSKYFEIEHDFEFKQLMNRVEGSSLSGDKKDDIKGFLDDVSNVVNYSTEKLSQVPTKNIKNLITKMKRIIHEL